MNQSYVKYLLVVFTLFIAWGCRQSKYVGEGRYLLKKNEIQFSGQKRNPNKLSDSHGHLSDGEMYELIRYAPNRKLKLFFYNRIDTAAHHAQVKRKEEKFRLKNEKRKKREDKINAKRIEKARSKGDSLYVHKVISKKEVKLGWREWVVNYMGQPPVQVSPETPQQKAYYLIDNSFYTVEEEDSVIFQKKFDSTRVEKNRKQLEIYLRKKGFYYGSVGDTITYKKRKRKATVSYIVDAGEPYRIRNVRFDSLPQYKTLRDVYEEYLEDEGQALVPGNLLDQDVLDNVREEFSAYCRNEGAYFGFNKNYIGFVVDTTVAPYQADIIIYVKPKLVKDPSDPDKMIQVDHKVFRIRHATFKLHNPDTSSFKNYSKFVERCHSLNLDPRDSKGRFVLLDTLEIYGKGTFIYNEVPFLDPNLLDKQNFLEIDRGNHPDSTKRYYKDYYVERSYRTLSNLEVFSNIEPRVEVDPEEPLGRFVVVTYDLMPLKKSSFLVAPRVTNTNGILGIEGQISYTNINLARGAQRLKISLNGGFESQPLIVGVNNQGTTINRFQLNTFEIGPTVSMTFPKLTPMPLPRAVRNELSKRLFPKTVVNLSANYQRRTEFRRSFVEFGHKWDFSQGKTQNWTLSFVKVKYVRLRKEAFFQEKLNQLNDPFLLNSYTDHFSTIMSATYHVNNLNSDARKKRRGRSRHHIYDFQITPSFSGFLWGLGYDQLVSWGTIAGDINADGLKQSFGVPYTQFNKIDVQYIANIYLSKKHHWVSRALAGVVQPYGNSPSVPYEQAFFGGGSNDIRAFEARTMAPGSTKTYADSNSTLTQIGDMKLEFNTEWRFEMTSLLDGAIFFDIGNIWNVARNGQDPNEPEYFQWNRFYRELAVGTGFGLRADFDFLVVRLDLSWALHNPHLPVGERWWWNPKTTYASSEYFKVDPDTGLLIDYKLPHPLRFNFGIGYPF